MYNYQIFMLLFLISSCSMFVNTGKEKEMAFLYLKEEWKDDLPLENARKVLSQEMSMAGGNYQVQAYPFSLTVIHQMNDEQSRIKSFTKEQKNKNLSFLKENYYSNKTCFHFQYQAIIHEKVSKLNNWHLTLILNDGTTLPLIWTKESKNSNPVFSKAHHGTNDVEQWIGNGVACTGERLNLTKGFELKVKPDYVQFPFDSYSNLSWYFPEYKTVEGKEVKIEKKSKNYKGYRGW